MFLMCNIIFYIVARDPIDNHKTCSVKKYTLPFTSLPTGTEKKLTLTSATANVHTIRKTFALIHPRIDKSTYATHPVYREFILRF